MVACHLSAGILVFPHNIRKFISAFYASTSLISFTWRVNTAFIYDGCGKEDDRFFLLQATSSITHYNCARKMITVMLRMKFPVSMKNLGIWGNLTDCDFQLKGVSSSSIRLRPLGLFHPPGNHLPISFEVFLYIFTFRFTI